MNDEYSMTSDIIRSPKYKCNKCNRITIIIGMVLAVSDNNIPKQGLEEFHRQYCMYCWRDFFDANVGQLTVLEEI